MKRFPFIVVLVLLLLEGSSFRNPGIISVGNIDSTSASDSILRRWLAPQTVYDAKPVFNSFYFWTTSEELDSVQSQHALLRTAIPGTSPEELYRIELLKESHRKNPLAAHLLGSDRTRTRSVWPCYWSLLPESWAQSNENQLVQVFLMDSALIVTFHPGKGKKTWQVFDTKGRVVPMKKAIERKRHIAVVYVSSRTNQPDVRMNISRSTDLGMNTGPVTRRYDYRTFILVNENMIASWHHAVPGMQAKMLSDLNYLLLLHAWFNDNPLHRKNRQMSGHDIHDAWRKLPSGMKRISEMLFATERYSGIYGYSARPETTKRIVDFMRERWPKQVKPVEKFPAAGVK